MFSMMIVDDEPVIRQGIKTSIDWSTYGINIVGEASNGQEALEKIIKLKPNILITDIRMPVMDGLELAEQVRLKQADTKIIILSGYDDFQYAKKSINLKVTEYLLKPFGAEELIEVILNLKEKIISENQEKEEVLYNKMIMQENIGLIQSRFIQNLLTNKYTDYSYISNKAKTLNINLIGPYYQILLIDIDDYFLISEDMSTNQEDILINSILNTSLAILNRYLNGTTICRSNSDYLITLINCPTAETSFIIKVCQDIQNTISEQLKISVTIGIGKMYNDISFISHSYQEALMALRKKVYKGKGSIIFCGKPEEHEKNKPVFYPTDKEKELLNEFRFLNKSKVLKMIDLLFKKFTDEMALYTNVKNISLRLILMALGVLEEMGIDIEKEFQGRFMPSNDIEKYETIDDIKIWLENLFFKFIDIIKNNKSKKYNSIVNTALQYVKENYHQDISLEDIANVVHVTPNYFSRIFKEETSKNFTTWLNKYRIEQAKDLLKNNSLIRCYEVSNRVGYNDYKYFSTIFKKITGFTPGEYKKKF